MIPLKSAVLCVECEAITHGRNNQCEVCGSSALLSVAAILDRNSAPASKAQDLTMAIGAA